MRPLNKHEYILDVTTEAELVDSSYSLWFRRVIWTQPLRFENELCVAMQYNQVRFAPSACCASFHASVHLLNLLCVNPQILPDYRKGLLNVLPQGKVSDQQFHQISKLAALQHRAKDGIFIPSMWESSSNNIIEAYFHSSSWLHECSEQEQPVRGELIKSELLNLCILDVSNWLKQCGSLYNCIWI